MPETYASWNTDRVMPQSAIWVTCRECGNTERVLAVMASRVLRDREKCPGCLSSELPRLNQTPIGAGIVLSEAQRTALRETEDEHLHAWVADAPKEHWLHWLQEAATRRLAHRFSRRSRMESDVPLSLLSSDPVLGMATSKTELS